MCRQMRFCLAPGIALNRVINATTEEALVLKFVFLCFSRTGAQVRDKEVVRQREESRSILVSSSTGGVTKRSPM
jgi:hypothetical protein